jgi:hypothetical protein
MFVQIRILKASTRQLARSAMKSDSHAQKKWLKMRHKLSPEQRKTLIHLAAMAVI